MVAGSKHKVLGQDLQKMSRKDGISRCFGSLGIFIGLRKLEVEVPEKLPRGIGLRQPSVDS